MIDQTNNQESTMEALQPTVASSGTVPEELLTGPEAQRFAKASKETLRKWRRRGLRAYGSGKKLRYTRKDLLDFIMLEEASGIVK